MIKKKETHTIEKYFCSNCNSELEDYDWNHHIPKKCPRCKKEICPKCTGYTSAEIANFKVNSSFSHTLFLTTCLECGIKVKAELVKLGFKVEPPRDPHREEK
jgi:phage FluMu protein Com